MKSNTRKKILALFAAGVLAVAGTAWAVVSNGTVSNTGASQVADFPASPNTVPAVGYSLASSTINLLGDTVLPTRAQLAVPYNLFQGSNNTATTVLQDGEVLNIKPADDGGTLRFISATGTAPAGGTVAGSVGTGLAGVLRLRGGTTNVYGAGDNHPDNTTFNNYGGGTYLIAGRLNVAHSNALGLAAITLANDTTFGVIDTSNVDIGGTAPNNMSLNNPNFQAGMYHQNIVLRRHDGDITTPNGGQNVRNVTFDVPTVAGVNTLLRVYTGIAQEDQTVGTTNWATAAPDYPSTGIVKTGTGNMEVHSQGITHFGGTHVKEGNLFVDGGTTNFFVGELGATWNFPWEATMAVETNSAKVNYDAYIVADLDQSSTNRPLETPAPIVPGTRFYSGIPAYMNTMDTDGSWALVQGGGYTNPLTVDAGASVKVNRDQFIGDLNGAGTFYVQHWAKGGVEVIPQITMQINNTLSTNGGTNAAFTGTIDGKVNLVLDNPVQATGAGVNTLNQTLTRINNFPRIQALTGNNNIVTGDTFIKDGTLSINKATNIGPGTLRIGMYKAGYEHAMDGTSPGTDTYRGFGDTMNVATFHGIEDFTVNQPTIIYQPGLNVGGAVNAAVATDALWPNAQTRSVTWYGNNPENVTFGATNFPVGTDGRYNTVGPNVNLAASRGKTVGFSDLKLYAQNGAVPTIAQFSDRNDIRYIMRNAMAINDRMDENPNWDGTVAFTASWDMVGATSARMFGFDVKAGVLQLSEEQQGGFALVGLRQGATLSLGNNAREFADDMQVVIEDDARIRVKPQTTDLAASLAEAQTKDPVFMADSINYTGLGQGQDHMDKRIVVQVDLSNIGNAITDQWIKVVGSHNAVNWNNIHFYSSSAGQTEHLYKVKVAQPNNMVFDGNYSVTPYCDENQYNIYVHIKKIDQPTPSSNFTFDSTGTSVATNAKISGSATLKDNAGAPVASQDVTFYLFHAGVDYADNSKAIESMTSTTDANGVASYLFDKGGYGNGAGYVIKAVATGYSDGTKAVTTTGGVTPGTSSSSGCDAGFGAFALLAMAGGALVLRKKD